jgi:hypothetical protein
MAIKPIRQRCIRPGTGTSTAPRIQDAITDFMGPSKNVTAAEKYLTMIRCLLIGFSIVSAKTSRSARQSSAFLMEKQLEITEITGDCKKLCAWRKREFLLQLSWVQWWCTSISSKTKET